ncbi:MAG: hypothetical protein U0175_14845 [Caldilineaceae bacterium]
MESRLRQTNDTLMESSQIVLPSSSSPLLIYRGMRLQANDGSIIGFVAAVVVAADTQRATHLLLIRHCGDPQYQLLPIQAIDRIDADSVRLQIPFRAVAGLPTWCNSC